MQQIWQILTWDNISRIDEKAYSLGVRGQLSVPSVVLGAEMSGASLYGSFRTGIEFGSGDASVSDVGSRWGIKGSYEVSEGLTASYKYEGKINTTNAESFGGAGHSHAETLAEANGDFTSVSDNAQPLPTFTNECSVGNAYVMGEDGYEAVDAETGEAVTVDDVTCGSLSAKNANDGGPGGRLSYIALSGGFGTITLGQIWSASANHYGFALDPSWAYGVFGGASYRNANTVSYSSSAGDVSFQIDKVTGDDERLEFGATAALGPVGVGLGYWSNANDAANFTGVALSAGAAGVNLTIGLGSEDSIDENGMIVTTDVSILYVNGSLGDSGVSYAVQVANSDAEGGGGDQNVVQLNNSLGDGASLIFEHLDPGGDGDSKSTVALVVNF